MEPIESSESETSKSPSEEITDNIEHDFIQSTTADDTFETVEPKIILSDEEIEMMAKLEEEKLERQHQITESMSTVLKFMFLDGSRREVILYVRPLEYSDLQREIARIYPQSKTIFSILDNNDVFVDSKNYRPCPFLKVKEYNSLRIPTSIPYMPAFWEFRGYHAGPEVWESYQERQERLQREKEEEERKRAEDEVNDFDREVIRNRLTHSSGHITSPQPSSRSASPSSRPTSQSGIRYLNRANTGTPGSMKLSRSSSRGYSAMRSSRTPEGGNRSAKAVDSTRSAKTPERVNRADSQRIVLAKSNSKKY
mmetsp:Transcript_33709/g.34338  ORF Transcript_33709/g.34338 Transcript_33709/m.34338 type:complete len:310 (+) Transcript_33709:292-1221(+)|eukprot:CAMPEP_0182422186 /NCGR_PEP_ID=MMETSP1167-20130531/7789_1 /TAXON_ID=2988 /ORGANISM="Mallomonas Sp, Strain CCMP3275" /LENGTH=309 /DNA_ID=CAMNT_0024599997 /DNA_START=218 /DNA_END=1147 /DNA_ORIENTATION=-